MSAPPLPAGTVTFLLTDVEGSTRLWQERPDGMGAAVARHEALIRAAVEGHGGTLVKSRGEGDSTFAVFARPTEAVSAVVAAQRALNAEPWPAGIRVKVRAALHTGVAELRDGDYYGPVVNRCARLRAIAHGGQTICSRATAELLTEPLSSGASLRDLGTCRLRDFDRPERVFQIEAEGIPVEFPPLRSAFETPTNLPVQRSSFVGREREVAEVGALLANNRLVTLTGVGGCGKTRLALRVAHGLLATHEDGVFFCDLAPISEPEALDRVVAQALRLAGATGRLREELLTHLGPRALLLLLDNCEHLTSACAEFADAVLERCPAVRVLATSREALRVEGEVAYAVPSLGLPRGGDPAEAEAIRLFAERARAERQDFSLERHPQAVVEICSRLDGIPLAIELAAARIAHLTPEQIVERLAHRFRLLAGGRRRVPRQQTLEATLDWSHDLLSRDEQRLLRRLAVFAGGFTLAAAEGVCSEGDTAVLDLLASLVAKSLVAWEAAESGPRYRLLETVRLYAEAKLVAAEEAVTYRSRHRDWFLAWLESFSEEEEISGGRVREEEIANIRAAIEWSVGENRADLVARLGAAAYGVMDGYPHEGGAWLDLGKPGVDDLDRRQKVRWLVAMGWNGLTLVDGRVLALEEAIALGGEERWGAVMWAHLLWALFQSYQAMFARRWGGDGRAFEREAIRLLDEFMKRTDGAHPSWKSSWLPADIYLILDMLPECVAWLDRVRDAPLDENTAAWQIFNEGTAAVALHILGRHQEAYEAAERARGFVSQWIGRTRSYYVHIAAVVPGAVALAAVGRGDEGRAYVRDMLPDVDKMRVPLILNSLVIGLAAVAASEGDWHRAAVLRAATGAAGGMFRDPTGFALFRHYGERIREHLGEAELRECQNESASMTLQQALAFGLEPTRRAGPDPK